MEKRLKDYLDRMEQLEFYKLTNEQCAQIARELLVQIGFFQHERLVHLIVTITFAVLTMMSVLAALALVQPGLFLLTVLLVVLLVPYIRHYYILENGVQKLYAYYDKLAE